MNTKQPPMIKAIHDRTKETMNKYLDKNHFLKNGIEDELNHNPMISDHIGDTLHNIESAMNYISVITLEPAINKNRELMPCEQTIIHLLSNSATKALKFEQERACFMMSNNNQGE